MALEFKYKAVSLHGLYEVGVIIQIQYMHASNKRKNLFCLFQKFLLFLSLQLVVIFKYFVLLKACNILQYMIIT